MTIGKQESWTCKWPWGGSLNYYIAFLTLNNPSITGADPEFFPRGRGGWLRRLKKEKCLSTHVHVSTRVHLKTRQTCNSFSLFSFPEDCLIYFLFCFNTFFEKGRGGAIPVTPPPPQIRQHIKSLNFTIYEAVSLLIRQEIINSAWKQM